MTGTTTKMPPHIELATPTNEPNAAAATVRTSVPSRTALWMVLGCIEPASHWQVMTARGGKRTWLLEALQKDCDVGHPLRMPIAQFENRNETPLVLSVQPWGDKHDVPHLATAGIRYSLKDGAEDRCYTVVADGAVDFWCNADSYELDIVCASAFDRLSWNICVNGGWCGGIMDGNPTTVDDLLPQTGEINARQFAELAMRADGWVEGEPFDDKHLRWLQAKFFEHLGATSVSAEDLRRNVARPFGDTTS